MNRNPILILLLCLGLSPAYLLAQNEVQFGQWMNVSEHYASVPASKRSISVYSFGRLQWMGLNGSPRSGGIGGHYRINGSIGASLYGYSDKVGDISFTKMRLAAFYALGKNANTLFSLGPVFKQSAANQSFISIDDPSVDPLLANAIQSRNDFDFDFGFESELAGYKIRIGLLNLLAKSGGERQVNSSRIWSLAVDKLVVFRKLGGLRTQLMVFAKGETQNLNKTLLEVAAVAELSPEFAVGAGYRWGVSFPIYLQYRTGISGVPMKIMYSYDLETNSLRTSNSGSHEISIRFNLRNPKSKNKLDDLDGDDTQLKNVRFL